MADPSVKFKEVRLTKPHSIYINACAISPDGSLVATGTGSGSLYRRNGEASVIDVTNGNVIDTAKYETTSVSGFAWHSDGNRFVSSCNDGTVTEVIRSNGKWSHRSVYKHNTQLLGCAVRANGLVAVACNDSCVVILDSNSNYSEKQKIDGLVESAMRVSFSSNGYLLAIGCHDGTHYVYGQNQSNGQYEQLTQRKHHTQCIDSLSFSPSGSHLIIGSVDKTASLWNVPSAPMDPSTWPQSPSLVLEGHTDVVSGTYFTGDGRHVITASSDETIRIWRVSDGGHVDTLQAKNRIYSASFHSPTGRLIVGSKDGSIQSWQCPPYVPSAVTVPPIESIESSTPTAIPPPIPSFVDVHLRLSNAQKDFSTIESKLSSIDPSIRDAGARAAHLRKEIVRLQQLIAEYNKELASIETDAMKEVIKNIVTLEEQLENVNGEIFNCNRIIDHVTECYNTNGYFSSLQSGLCFDQWLFDSGMEHLIGQLDMNGVKLLQMSINDLMDEGRSYVDACDIHINACLTAHMQTVGSLPGVFNWSKDQVSTWLQSQGTVYSSLVSLGWTGPSLLALTPSRIESASNKTIRNDQARELKEAITSLIKDDNSLPKWLRKWNGALSIADYADFI